MNYEDKKIVAVLATNVEVATAFNVIGHLAISIGKYSDKELMGIPVLKDGSGVTHMGISRFPFIITKVKSSKLKKAIELAKKNPNLLVVDYPRKMIVTRTDEELVAEIAKKHNDQLEYMGAIFYGSTSDVNEITGKFQLWRMD